MTGRERARRRRCARDATEMALLTRDHGAATCDMWCERICPDVARASGERSWQRALSLIREYDIPRKEVAWDTARNCPSEVSVQVLLDAGKIEDWLHLRGTAHVEA